MPAPANGHVVRVGAGPLRFVAVPIDVAADVPLTSLQGDTRPITEWVTTFQLALVVLDPYTHEAAWILPTAGRILNNFAEADCRTAFLVTGPPEDARQFLGPWVEELMVFTDEDRLAVKGFGLESLPAFVHIDQNHAIVTKSEGWDPTGWRAVATELARVVSWRRPTIPDPSDPAPFAGCPALG